jgi:hypothetical protein
LPVGAGRRKQNALPRLGAEAAPDGLGPDEVRWDEARPDPASQPIRIPNVEDGLIGRRLRAVPVADAMLDELAAEAIGLPGWAAIPGDSTARPTPPREPGAGLAGLAATLIAAGSWGYRARFRSVRSRRAEQSRPK